MTSQMEKTDFKTKVKDEIIKSADLYKSYFVDFEYLICSKAFIKQPFYIISSHEDNFAHLTGVHTKLDAKTFFQKSFNKTLSEDDFDFIKNGQDEKAVKGLIRLKIKVLSEIINIFSENSKVEEDFNKGKINCSFAAGNTYCTLGFTLAQKSKPKTLLKGYLLNENKAKPLDLVLRKPKTDKKFNEILIGNNETLETYANSIKELVTENIIPTMKN